MASPWLADFDPFTLEKPRQFRAEKPPSMKSGRYARDYDEVSALGARVDGERSVEQTNLAYFYSDNTIVLWNRGLRALANEQIHDIADSARFFALANLATADAVITAWDSKVHYNFWRPSTAIHEGDNDGNRHTDGDADWEPLINYPPYPDYTSGANNVAGAMTRIAELLFRTDDVTFTLTSAASQLPMEARTRTYYRFSDASWEMVEARILLGIHFRFADEAGRKQGRSVAKWAFQRIRRPLDECRHGRRRRGPR